MGEILRQRDAIDAWFEAERERLLGEFSKRRVGRMMAKRRNILNYLEVGYSEIQLRCFLALYLWEAGWTGDYDECPECHKAQADAAPYEEVICTLVGDWARFKQMGKRQTNN